MDKKFSSVKILFFLIVILILFGIVAALEQSARQQGFANFQNSTSKTASPSLENSLRSNILDTETQSSSPVPDFSYATTTISAPNGNIIVQIADTLDKETQGLSNRNGLAEGTGMLFAFENLSPQYMWMKDMNFPLDMVWLDQNKKIVHIETDVTPESYLENPPKIFSSTVLALYVIEIPSGDATRLGFSLGESLSFALSH